MKNKTLIRKYTVIICDDCMNLKGEMCNTPECVFCRKTMTEVDELLEGTMITAKVAGYKQEGEILKFS